MLGKKLDRKDRNIHLDVSVNFLLCMQIVQALAKHTDVEPGFNLDRVKMTGTKQVMFFSGYL